MRTEPARNIGLTISGVLYAVWAVLKAGGVEVTDDLRASVEALILVLCAIPAVGGFVTRMFVVSPQTAADAVVRAKNEEPTTTTVPAIGGPAGGAYADAVRDQGFRPAPPAVENP